MELTANALQTVLTYQNVFFTDSAVPSRNCSIVHREGSGLVTLRGLTTQCRARFKVTFGANIAIPAGGDTAVPVSLAIAINGEPVNSTIMTSTPAALSQFNNVFSAIYIDVPAGCCSQISVENVGAQTVDVQNANLIVERVA